MFYYIEIQVISRNKRGGGGGGVCVCVGGGALYCLTLCMLGNFSCLSADFFFKITFFKEIFHEQYQSAKRFGFMPGPTSRRPVGPDLGPNCKCKGYQ